MWKLLVGFVAFAALAMFILTRSGGNVDMGGEKHEVVPAGAEPAASGAIAASSASAPASAASN